MDRYPISVPLFPIVRVEVAGLEKLDYELLPDSGKEIADLVGIEAASEIISRLGGTQVYIPCRVTISNSLVDHFGIDVVARLATRHGGCELDIPMAQKAVTDLKHRRVLSFLAGGASDAAAALRFGTTTRNIRRIKRKYAISGRRRKGADTVEKVSSNGH